MITHAAELISAPQQLAWAIGGMMVALSGAAIIGAMCVNFLLAPVAGPVIRERRSVVATGTMLLYFYGYYLLIHHRVGVWHMETAPLVYALAGIGAVVVVFSAVFNIVGRIQLGRNWANQATLYAGQTLVTDGVFAVVRHPLYASLIWFAYGVALIYQSYAGALATALVFYPAMAYRATQEEALLSDRFDEYPAYRRRVGRFWMRTG